MPPTVTMTAPEVEPHSAGLAGDSARIGAAVAISRMTGLLRIVVVAAVLGPTVLGDLFVAVNVLPLLLYDIIAGSAISSVLVPPLVRLWATEPIERVRRFVGNASGLIVAALSFVVMGALLGRGWIADALTAGVDRAVAGEASHAASLLILLIVPQLVLYALIGVFVSVQHSRRRFLLPSAAPIIENLLLIATVLTVGARYGSDLEVTSVPAEALVLLGVGSGIAVSVHALVQWIGARRALGSFRLSFDRRDPLVRGLAGPTRDSFGWSAVVAARQFALVVAASFAGAGAVQAFEMATLVYFIPVALVGRPVASAALPRLAEIRGHDDEHTTSARLASGYRSAIRLAAWLAVPAGLAMAVLAGPLAAGVTYGQFDSDTSIQLVTYGLVGLGLGAASEALFEVARQATMAQPGDRTALRRSTWVRAIVAIVGIPAVVVAVDGPVILAALGLVVSIGDLAALGVIHRSLRPKATGPAFTDDGNAQWPRIIVASAGAVGLAAAVDGLLFARWSGTIGNPARLVGVATVAVAAYLVAGWLSIDRGRLLAAVGGPAPIPRVVETTDPAATGAGEP